MSKNEAKRWGIAFALAAPFVFGLLYWAAKVDGWTSLQNNELDTRLSSLPDLEAGYVNRHWPVCPHPDEMPAFPPEGDAGLVDRFVLLSLKECAEVFLFDTQDLSESRRRKELMMQIGLISP